MITVVRLAIIAGIIFVALGFVFSIFQGLPHFPGDFFYQKENFTFYFPVVTCGIIAAVVTAILWFLKKI